MVDRGFQGDLGGCWSVSRGILGLRDADLRPLQKRISDHQVSLMSVMKPNFCASLH